MLEGQIMKEIRSALLSGFSSLGLTVAVKQDYQPTQQGANSSATVYLHSLPDVRIGQVERTDVWDETEQKEVHTEKQRYEGTVQVTATYPVNPSDVSGLTAKDIANYAASILQSETSLNYLFSKGISPLRISQINNTFYVNDRDQNEAFPSFDFKFLHEQVIITETPIVDVYDYIVDSV